MAKQPPAPRRVEIHRADRLVASAAGAPAHVTIELIAPNAMSIELASVWFANLDVTSRTPAGPLGTAAIFDVEHADIRGAELLRAFGEALLELAAEVEALQARAKRITKR